VRGMDETKHLRIHTPRPERGKVFQEGELVVCLGGFDHEYHVAHVVERKEPMERKNLYYVHYEGYDKRLDEWVDESRVEEWNPSPNTPTDASRYVERPSPASKSGSTTGSVERRITRHLKRTYQTIHHIHRDLQDLSPIDRYLEKEHEEKTKLKNIHLLQLGPFEMETWYYAPYPGEYGNCSRMHHCNMCLKYFRKQSTLYKHLEKCSKTSPPGMKIYQAASPFLRAEDGKPDEQDGTQGPISVYEIDGSIDKLYCQNLCLLAKLFLDHKTLYFDVDPFMFYVLTQKEPSGKDQLVGYFSKEKGNDNAYNLACILTLPAFQRKGYGKFLIAFSYELSRREDKLGTPERPLSDLGLVSYKSYWARMLLEVMYRHKGDISIKEASRKTGILPEDVVLTLQSLHLLKYWKGQHVVSATPKVLEEHLKRCQGKRVGVDSTLLQWEPRHLPSTRKP